MPSLDERFALVSFHLRPALCRTAVLDVAVPLWGVARVADLTEAEIQDAVASWTASGFVQKLAVPEVGDRYRSERSARAFLMDPARLSEDARRTAHAELAKVLRALIEGAAHEKGAEPVAEEMLRSCLDHAFEGGAAADRRWAAIRIAKALRSKSAPQAAVDLLTPLAGPNPDADLLEALASALSDAGRRVECRARREEALELHRQTGDRKRESAALLLLGTMDMEDLKLPQAREKLERAMSLRRADGDRRGLARVLQKLGSLHLYEGRNASARQHLDEALRTRRELGEDDRASTSMFLTYELGVLDFQEHKLSEAQTKLEKWLEHTRAIGDPARQAHALGLLATIDNSSGRRQEALEKHKAVAALWRSAGDRPHEVNALASVATTALAMNDIEEAASALTTAFGVVKQLGDTEAELTAMEGLALFAWKRGLRDVAMTLLAFGEVAREDGPKKEGAAKALQEMVGVAGLDADDTLALKRRAAEVYRKNRGQELVQSALADLTRR